ncbi:hypothetical protein [Sporofaciens sp. JLR.KK001]|uniref:hypothetical protein n=1 Tax=Sporofaciens sp. JLR.KK001 TaxID=3112621 RepID=UPI002FF40826
MGEQEKAKITFFAAECMEFLDYGELYEDLSLPEAVEAYQRICKKGFPYGPGIGFNLKDPEAPKYSDINWPLYQGGRIALEEIRLIPAYQSHPLVRAAVQEMEGYLSNMSKNGKQNRGMERQKTAGKEK